MKFNLQSCRKRAGYSSAREFAESIGLSVGTYTNYEQGKTKLTLEKAWEFADLFRCTLDELAGRDFRPQVGAASTPDLGDDERELIGLYRDADARGQFSIMAVAQAQQGMETKPQDSARRAG